MHPKNSSPAPLHPRSLAPLLLLLALASCQPAPQSTRKTLTIALIPKALDSPVSEISHSGAIKKAAELSVDGGVKVNIVYAGSVSSDAAEQMHVLEDVVASGVDGVALSCVDPTACIDPINRAVAAGVPVMTWDSDAPQSKRFTYLGVDNYLAGRVAGNLLVSALHGRGQVAILTGVPGTLNLEERIRGCKDVLSLFPGVQVVATVASNEDINHAVQALEETMQAHPDLDGWFFTGAWPLLAERSSMPLWKAAALKRGMQTVAFDTLPVELELLRDGYLTYLVGQKNWEGGYVSVQILYDRLVNHRNFAPFIDSGIDIVLNENVESMLRAWDTNYFSLNPP